MLFQLIHQCQPLAQRRGRMRWRRFDWQAKLPAIPKPLGLFFFYLAWREIFSALIPAVMKFLLEMSLESRRTPRGQRKSQFWVALNWVCAPEFVVEGGWMWSDWRLFCCPFKMLVRSHNIPRKSVGMNICRTVASWQVGENETKQNIEYSPVSLSKPVSY